MTVQDPIGDTRPEPTPKPSPFEAPALPSRREHRLILRVLFAVAQSDATVSREERVILEHYRRVLDVSGPTNELLLEEPMVRPGERSHGEGDEAPGIPELRQIPEVERVHVLRMMMQVAYADGRCSDLELDVLRRLAGIMGLSTLQFADVQDSVEGRVRERRRTRRWFAILVIGLVVIVPVLVFVILNPGQDEELHALLLETQAAVEGLRGRVADVVEVGQAGPEADSIARISEELDRFEVEIREQLARTEQTPRAAVRDDVALLPQELAVLRRKIETIQERQAVFKRLEQRYTRSVVLIKISYSIVGGNGKQVKGGGEGTGFFVTSDGVIATNKHVVQPWKFDAEAIRMLANGYRLDESSVRIVAWPGGTTVWDAEGNTSLDGAFDSRRGDLRVVAVPPDRFEQRAARLYDGTMFTGEFHVQDDSDLALLRASVRGPVEPLPLAESPVAAEKLDRVMVLGFPGGTDLIENGVAETSPALGEIRKIENSLFVTVSIVPGNSGGPLIDQQGRVLGVAARRLSEEATLGVCVRSRHLRALMASAATD